MKKKFGLQVLSEIADVSGVIYLRHVERSIRPEVGRGYPEALLDLFGFLRTEMLDVAILGLDVVRVEVGDGGNIRVGDLTVVAFVVIVGEDLPVEVALLLPSVIKCVLLKVIVLEPRLLVDPFKVILPRHFGRLARIHVDPDKTIPVNVRVNRSEILLVESFDASLVVDNDKLVPSGLVWSHVPRVRESMLVCSEEPLPGEDGSLFELVHRLRRVPASGKSTHRRLLVLRSHRGGTEEVPQERHGEYVFVIRKSKENCRRISTFD